MSTITDLDILTKPVNVMFLGRFLERAQYFTNYHAGTKAASVSHHRGTLTAFWRRHEHLTPSTTALTELNTTVSFPTRTSSTPTITDVTKAVAKYGAYFVLSEEADLVNFNGQTAELLDVLAAYAGRSMNMVTRNEMEDNATQIYSGNVASDGLVYSAITAAGLDFAINALDRNVASTFTGMTTGSGNIGTQPILSAYWGHAHPDVAYDLSKLAGWKSVETYAGQVSVLPNEIGLYGRAGKAVRFISSPDASVDTGAGTTGAGLRETTNNADLYSVPIYGENAVGTLGFDADLPESIMPANSSMGPIQIIQHMRGSGGVVDPLNELMTLGTKFWAGAQITNTNWIRSVRCGATLLTG